MGWGEQGGGYIDQTIGGVTYKNVNDQHVYGGRLTLLFKPSDALTLTAGVTYQHVAVDGSQAWFAVSPLDGVTPLHPYQNLSPTREPYRDRYTLAYLNANYDVGIGSLLAAFSYGNKYNFQPEDSTPTAFGFGLPWPTSYVPFIRYHDYTGELRFTSSWSGPLQLVAGAYYQQDQTYFNSNAIISGSDGVTPCYTIASCQAAGLYEPGNNFGPVQNSVILYGADDLKRTNQYAVYAQADYHILENLTATAGIRYFNARVHESADNTQDIAPGAGDGGCAFVTGCLTTPYQTFDGKASESKTTYNFALLWKPTTEISLYARAASGFRIGGINTSYYSAVQFGDNTVPLTYQPDSLWDYEVGAKAYFFDRKLFVDLSYYHINWTNQQVEAESQGAFGYTLNAGKTSTDGIELDGTLKPITGLTVSGSITYVDATLAEDLPADVAAAGTPGYKGDRVPFVPKWNATAQAEYEAPITSTISAYGQVDMTYRSDTATGFNSGDNYYAVLPSYTLWDLRLGVRWANYDASVFVQNVGDKAAYVGLDAQQDGLRVFSPRPRTIGVKLSAGF